jgi:hypothetical protein
MTTSLPSPLVVAAAAASWCGVEPAGNGTRRLVDGDGDGGGERFAGCCCCWRMDGLSRLRPEDRELEDFSVR